jgi:hypothetical protein
MPDGCAESGGRNRLFFVEVGQDARHGTLARVSLLDVPATRRATLEQAVLRALGVFAVHHEIHFADSQIA